VSTLDWLFDSDPAVAWQAKRDLTDASPGEIAAVRARVPHEGLGAAILAFQHPDGSWRRTDAPAWLSTLFTLLLLRATGIDPVEPSVSNALARLESSLRWDDSPGCWDLRPVHSGGNAFFDGEVEPCINGGVLALSGFFGHPSENLARRLLSEQLADGGWNCEAPKSTRSSFHTTLCVLEGLLEFERAIGPAAPISAQIASVRRRGEEYLLRRSLFRRLSTGEVVNPAFLEFAFPPRYRYDILRALDYFRSAGAMPDPRVNEAVRMIHEKRQADGRWLLDRAYDEALTVPVGESAGEPSRWNTLRALRVLRWHRGTRLEDGGSSI
jgi:hypothetical protein